MGLVNCPDYFASCPLLVWLLWKNAKSRLRFYERWSCLLYDILLLYCFTLNLNETGKQSLHTGFVFCWCMQVLSKLSFAFFYHFEKYENSGFDFSRDGACVYCIIYSFTDMQDKLEKLIKVKWKPSQRTVVVSWFKYLAICLPALKNIKSKLLQLVKRGGAYLAYIILSYIIFIHDICPFFSTDTFFG